ncbi:hypothetical protein [Nocardioides plantarum]|uniref:Uncharacterized protein n=1 Tax=Nocardioides plantarum TaxID=29299 RepID=A0ABV5KAV9_9ACTN|nr:hypothetical protein [Nocardioides plantarum]
MPAERAADRAGPRGTVDRSGFATGLPIGPLLVVVAYAALRGAGVVLDDWMLVALVAWPVLPALLAALVLVAHRRWWLSLAIGCLVGTAVTVAAVVGLVAGLAYLLSEPAGR